VRIEQERHRRARPLVEGGALSRPSPGGSTLILAGLTPRKPLRKKASRDAPA